MIYGYARFSTDRQSLANQIKELRNAGAEKVFRETARGAKSDRAQLRRALDQLAADDVRLVARIDRLARSTRDLLNILAAIAAKGALPFPWRQSGRHHHGARALDFDRQRSGQPAIGRRIRTERRASSAACQSTGAARRNAGGTPWPSLELQEDDLARLNALPESLQESARQRRCASSLKSICPNSRAWSRVGTGAVGGETGLGPHVFERTAESGCLSNTTRTMSWRKPDPVPMFFHCSR